MNRLLQHFVDSSGSQASAASRPPIAAPPQSSGGSYHAGNRGSYQRAARGGPFFYQPPPQGLQQNNGNGSGLEEIPLTSQSTGGLYETVDLNADSSQQHRPPQHQNQHRLVNGSNNQAPFYHQKAPGSTGSAADLFASAPPPARELFGGPPSSNGSGGNPYRRKSNPVNNSFAASNISEKAMFAKSPTPPKDLFAAPVNGVEMFAHNASPNGSFAGSSQNGDVFDGQATQQELFAAPQSEDSNGFDTEVISADPSAHDPFAEQPKDTNVQYQQHGYQQQYPKQNLQPNFESSDPFSSTPSRLDAPADAFASAPSQASASVDPFASTLSHSGCSPFNSPSPSIGHQEQMASADSLFSSPAPINNGNWTQPTQPEPSPIQSQHLFASDAPTASSLFGGDAPSQFQANPLAPSKSQINALPTPPKPQFSAPPSPLNPQIPSPAKSSGIVPPSPNKPPVGAPTSPMIYASSPPLRPQVSVPASPVMRPEDQLTPAFGSMKVSTPGKSPMKAGLDVRHMKFPAGRREDDAVSNAPSMAPSRMSMLSTLDDSLKLSDMYKQMTSRLEGEKHDLLKVVTSQAQEIAQMKKQIQSLELQLKKCRPKNV